MAPPGNRRAGTGQYRAQFDLVSLMQHIGAVPAPA
jgi:hypothetical protein